MKSVKKINKVKNSSNSNSKKISKNNDNSNVIKNYTCINMKLKTSSYKIFVGKNILKNIIKFFPELKNTKVAIISDNKVPKMYIEEVAKAVNTDYIFTFPNGEKNKNIETYLKIEKFLVKNKFTRKDSIIALGGGVVGDMVGFVASTYMRGIKFYNIPTTVLSCVDSSIGGKVAIDFEGYKNTIGAFYQPSGVVVDLNTFKTLPKKQIANGLAESIKMGITLDKTLFEIFEKQDYMTHIEQIVIKSLNAKKKVVEKDEKEQNIRKVLNFGHTIGHAIETKLSNNKLLHGECVAIGMTYMIQNEELKNRLIEVLIRTGLPYKYDIDLKNRLVYNKLYNGLAHDKKTGGNSVSAIFVDKIGKAKIENISIMNLIDIIK